MADAEAQADGDPGQDTPEPDSQETDFAKIPTREALEVELLEAETQVEKLTKILALPDPIIELFLGTDRYL